MMANQQTQINLSAIDRMRWSLAGVLLIAGIGGFYYFADQALLYRVLGLVGLVASAGLIALGTEHGLQLRGFARESRAELRKVIWATRAETLQTTLVVFVAVIIMALFLWLLDRVLSWAIGLFLGV